MAVENIRGAIEAILFANGASVEFSRIAQALEISEKKVKEHISALIDDYEASGRGITIILLDNSCQMVSKGICSANSHRYGFEKKHSAFTGSS